MNDLEFFLSQLEGAGDEKLRPKRSITLRQYAGYWLGRAGAPMFKEAVERFNAKPNGSWQEIEDLSNRDSVEAVIRNSPFYKGVFALSVVYFRLDDSAQRLFLFVSRLVPEWNLTDKHPHQGMRVLIHVMFLLYDWTDFVWKWRRRLIWALSDKELREISFFSKYLSPGAIRRVVSRIAFAPMQRPKAWDHHVRHLLRVLVGRQFVRKFFLKTDSQTVPSAERRRAPTPFAVIAEAALCTAIEKLSSVYYAIVHGVFFQIPDTELPTLARVVTCMTGGNLSNTEGWHFPKLPDSCNVRAKKRDTSQPKELGKGTAFGLPGHIGIDGLSTEESETFAGIARCLSHELEMCRHFGDAKEAALLLLLSKGAAKEWVDPGERVIPKDWGRFLQHLRSIAETIPHLVAALPLFEVPEEMIKEWCDIRSRKIPPQQWSELCLTLRSLSDALPSLAEAMSLLELPVPLLQHLRETRKQIASTPSELVDARRNADSSDHNPATAKPKSPPRGSPKGNNERES